MKLIKNLICEMIEECESSIEYSCNALEYQFINPALGKMYHDLAGVEMQHARMFHEHAVKAVETAKESGKQPPAEMLEKYEKKHKEYIKLLEKAQVYYNLY